MNAISDVAKGLVKTSPFFCFILTIYRYKMIFNMKFVKPTKEQRDFIPTPLAAQENVKKVGIRIADQLVSFDYVRTADETKSLLGEKVDGEYEPSAMNIVDQKFKTTGLDFKSFDPRVLLGE